MGNQKRILAITLILFLTIFGCIDNINEANDYDKQTTFASGWMQDKTITIASADTYYPLTDWNMLEGKGLTYADGNITIVYDGNYYIAGHASFEGTVNNEYHIVIFKNNTKQDYCHVEQKVPTGAGVASVSLGCTMALTAGDYINVKTENTTLGNNITFHDITFNIQRISD